LCVPSPFQVRPLLRPALVLIDLGRIQRVVFKKKKKDSLRRRVCDSTSAARVYL
jgi:hypothetical protein